MKVEIVAERIREAIRAGDLRPGQVVSLRDIAEREEVRLGSLLMLLASRADRDLYEVRGDTAIVSPLNLAELRSVHNFNVTHLRDLVARSCVAHPGNSIDAIERTIPDDPRSLNEGPVGLILASKAFFTKTFEGVATEVDMKTWKCSMNTFRRYLTLGLSAIYEDSGASGIIAEDRVHMDGSHELVDSFRMRNESFARELFSSYIKRGIDIAQRSFELADTELLPGDLVVVNYGARAESGFSRIRRASAPSSPGAPARGRAT